MLDCKVAQLSFGCLQVDSCAPETLLIEISVETEIEMNALGSKTPFEQAGVSRESLKSNSSLRNSRMAELKFPEVFVSRAFPHSSRDSISQLRVLSGVWHVRNCLERSRGKAPQPSRGGMNSVFSFSQVGFA